MPLVSRGELIGAGVFSKNLNDLVTDFKANADMEVFFVGPSGKLASGTAPDIWDEVAGNLPANHIPFKSVAQVGDVIYEITSQPISGMTGDNVGRLVTAKVFTEAYNTQQYINYSSYGGLAVALIVLIIGISFYLRRNFRPLGIIVDVLDALMQGNLDVEVPKRKRQDEIGEIGRASCRERV